MSGGLKARNSLYGERGVKRVVRRAEKSRGKAILVLFAVALVLAGAAYISLMYSISYGGSEVPVVSAYRGDLIKEATFLKSANPKEKIYVTIALKWRNEPELDEFLKEVNNPNSPYFQKFMNYSEFKKNFAPTEDVYGEILSWIKENGVHVEKTYPLRNSITIYDTMGNISRLLDTEFGIFQSTGSTHLKARFFAAMAPPKIPARFVPYIKGIDGLDNSTNYHLNYYRASSGTDWLTGADVARMYRVYELYNDTSDGSASSKHIFATGLRVATVLWEGSDSSGNQYAPFDPNAIGYYYGHVIPTWIQNLGVNSTIHWYGTSGTVSPGSNTDGAVSEENELDLEMVGTLAPGVDAYCVYGPGNGQSPSESNFPDNEYDYIANTLASDTSAVLVAVSNSWGDGDYAGSATTDNDVKALNAMGVTVLASSGDDGDTTSPSYPSIDAQSSYGIIAVGGTSPVPNGYDITSLNDEATMGYNTNVVNPRSSEIVWYDASSTMSNGDHWGTQSGVSSAYPEPWFQRDYIGSYSGRVTADISAMGNRTLVYVSDGSGNNQWGGIAGTSVACPVTAGIVAEMAAYVGVQYGISNHGFGYFLPTIYQLGNDFYNNNKYSSSPPFFDVTQGSTGGGGSAAAGWDQVSGWGVPNAWELVHDIGFVLSSSSTSATITAGQTASYTIDVSFPYMWTCEVGHFTVGGLPSGASASTSVSYVFPSGNSSAASFTLDVFTSSSTPSGTYTLNLTAYTYNHTNGHWGNLTNYILLTLTVNPSNAPDLTITSISVSSSTVNEGQSITINATVKNVGDTDANNVYVGFYYDSVSSSTHIGNASVGTLAAGSSANVQITWDTTGHTGTHTLIAYADPDNIVAEKNETNNSASTSVTVNGYGVNLTVDFSSKTVLPSGSVNYTITVKNTGTLTDTFDLSNSSTSNGWTATLSSNKVTLDAGASTTVTLTVTAPSNANNGDSQNVTVTAVSEGDSSKSDSVTTTTTVSTMSITSITIFNHLEAIINYTTSQAVRTYVVYGIGPNHMDMQTPEESVASTQHEVAIQNLTPGVSYYFKIYMTDGTSSAWSSIYNFTLSGTNDFETSDNPTTLHNWNVRAWNSSTNAAANTIWQWGQPTAGPSSANSGQDVIGTVLNGYYGVDDHVDALMTPWIDLTNASWATLTFYAWYDLENTYDGLLIAYQNDSSSSWWVLDYKNNASQYDGQISSSYGSAIGGFYAFTGSTNGWVQKTFNTSTINDVKVNRYLLGHKVRFIFYFASDDSVHNHYGFYFDDIQVKAGIPVYHIYGYVKDSSGNAISGATVWVNDTTLGISYRVTTDSSGRYDVYTYNGINGDNLNVEAKSTQGSGSNSGTLSSEVEIDITLTAVPELSWFAPLVFVVFLGILLRRRNSS